WVVGVEGSTRAGGRGVGWRCRRGGVVAEGDVHPVIAGEVGAGREGGTAGVGIDTVEPVHAVGQGVQRCVVNPCSGKVVVVPGVVAAGGVVGGDVGGVGADGHWRGEVDLLPAAGRFVGERGGGQCREVGRPQGAGDRSALG